MKLSVDPDRCAPFNRNAGIDPIGSAGHYHSFILVEVALPWPREITLADELAGVTDVIDAVEARDGRLVRVLGIVPLGDRGEQQRRIIHYHRAVSEQVTAFDGHELVIEAGDEVATIEAMLDEPDSARLTPVAGPDVLICTHGSRDVCCGGDGMRLHLAAADGLQGVRVWRCSHTGGHRFAPTSITFPDGRFWAYLDEEKLAAIVDRNIDPASLRHNDRGSSGFGSPFAQIAERELFAVIGWTMNDGSRWVVHEENDGRRGSAQIVHEAPDGTRTSVEVSSELAQRYPAMVCGEGADPSGKTFDEYRVISTKHQP
ncbi:MAG TPA: sucrase ferredoxin [Acidimicrobiales bacterium]|nr:sucrase ferredoxin [Acidimicrobiales bacterium]